MATNSSTPGNTPLPSSAQQSPSTQSPKLDESFYTWTSFFNILLNRSTPHETASYFLARDIKNEEADCKRCESQVAKLFERSPIIRFMRSETQALGHDVGPEKILCRRCTTPQSGGFDSDYGIMLCANHMRNKGQIEDTLAHEMVHAYDHLRFKVDRWNLRHQACTEIRASTLSGECRFMREFFTRKQYKVTQQLQECVRRRATLSLMGRPECKDDVHAARIVNEVWEHCFHDTRPFDEIYR